MTAASHSNRRQWALLGLMLVCGGLIAARLVQLQVLLQPCLSARAERNATGKVTIPGPRGKILDRRGQVLAISVPTHVLLARPSHLSARGLRVLERAAGTPGRLTRRARRDTWIPVTRTCGERCKATVIAAVEQGRVNRRAVHLEPSFERRYPFGPLAAHVLGFVNRDGVPEGAEREFDDLLRSSRRDLLLERDARLQVLGSRARGAEQTPPSSVMLTLDLRIQQRLEQELQRSVEQHAARRAMGVVLDPRNGEVLAMASYPTYDPNHFSRAVAHHRNLAIGHTFEPGSVIKPLTAAALIETGSVSPRQTVYCEQGRWYWKGEGRGRPIRDHHPHQWLTLPQVLEVSSNIGIAKLSLRLSEQQLYQTLQRFGLGRRTGIDLPAEASGALRSPSHWQGRDRLAVAFGHNLSTTVLQLAAAYGALARDGRRPVPTIARAWADPEGRWHSLERSRRAVQAVSASTARRVSTWLEAVIAGEHGTAHRAAVPGYRAAGKTGTAEKIVAGTYDRRRNISTFAGFAPTTDPAAVVVITIDEPSRAGRDAGTVAAPAFSAVMAETLRLLRIPPSDPAAPTLVAARDRKRP